MLEFKDLCFAVEENGKEKVIIDHLNYTIDDNKLTVITGPNGGGKSTLAKLIAGIERPTQGSIVYNGVDNGYEYNRTSKTRSKLCFSAACKI